MNKKSKAGLYILTLMAILMTSSGIYAANPDTGRAALAKVKTNLTGWEIKGDGKLEDTAEGLLLTSGPQENVMAISDTVSEDFVYEADVMIKDMKADTSLLFRSNDDGRNSYMLQLIPESGRIRLKDAAGGAGKLIEERQVSLKEGEIYYLKVKAEGTSLKVYWGNGYKPVIDIQDSSYPSGRLGLHVRDGSALFQNITVSELKGNLGAVLVNKGQWQPDLRGLQGTSVDQSQAERIYNKQAADFIYEGTISFRSDAVAALAFRSSTDGVRGYEATLVKEGDQVRVKLTKADGTAIASSERTYPSQAGAKHYVEVKAKGSRIQIFLDGYTPAAIDVSDHTYSSGNAGFVVKTGSAYFQETYLTDTDSYYTETYRPQYHYTPIRGSASDPNGLVYFEGEYHLFHQDGGTWAHAVSKDMLNWKRLPIALPWNDYGHIWSGAAVADATNASGLFTDSGGKGLIAYYTSYNPDGPNGNQQMGLAYSKDQGRTWEYAKDRPIVIENPGKNGEDPGGWDFRDPKVIRDDENNRWVMVVSGGDHIRFFTSTNLLDWTLTDNWGYGDYVRGGVWECPDLFPLIVQGTSQKKWVLMISTGANPATGGSDSEYFVGSLTDEGKFVNDNPAGKVLRTDFGKEYYASMSFSDMTDGRRVMLAWMSNWDYPFAFPTSGWKGELTVPREVTLGLTKDGPRLAQTPVKEMELLRSRLFSTTDKRVSSSSPNLLKGLVSGAYEIEAELEIPDGSTVSEFGFNVREGANQKTVVGYKVSEGQLFVDRSASGVTDFSSLFSTRHEAVMTAENKRIKLRILVDESSVEVFANGGKVVFSEVIFPDPASRAMSFYTRGGTVKVVSLQVNKLGSVWNSDTGLVTRIAMDTSDRELELGQSETLQAIVENGSGNGVHPLKWKSSNDEVVSINRAGASQATLQAKKEGEAVITVSTPNGKVSSSLVVKVYGGEFHTNLSGWTQDLSMASWIATKDGIRGKYSSDANYMAQEKAGNFTYEADMKLGESGGAGSLLFRASEDGRSGYYLNLDPNMKSVRLFYKINGRFEERQVLAKFPAFIRPDQTYRIKIQAEGPHIMVYMGGQKIMDLKDGTFAEGHFGLHVFGGYASYQNVNVTRAEPAELMTSSLVNAAFQKSVYTDKLANGEAVNVRNADEAYDQKWVFVPTGDEAGSYSIRTTAGQALDLDTEQNKIQLYSYLGYNNQRWIVRKNEDGSVTILSVHHNRVLALSEDGSKLTLEAAQTDEMRNRWKIDGE
ncbi:GH32 C-terminal domain-containing protein [Paenibacillus albidus]|uniref:GH32 C-terminal domain-containing protein n=1 Tax=Paenibacillus albidus TaxID=2041023 RepID=UPI001BE71AE1|nr:GH32 C-terminal domain-containing protein [Paenibacillus albidus]MBT2287634.1 GH32 C-terminal domain-containing protein [Paenibacillus albidus]